MNDSSQTGRRLAGPSGIQELMDDLGGALALHPEMRMLGGGQPAAIQCVQEIWRSRIAEMLADESTLDRALLNYDPPGGNPLFREAMAAFLRRECGWEVSLDNIAVLPGGQTAFFLLFNLLAGETEGGKKRVIFPLMPEYIGYANQGLSADMLSGREPLIEMRGAHEFKYRVDFDRLRVTSDTAALCVSCPANPSGNVLTDEEFDRLYEIALCHDIPLMLDNAYGHPFPGVIHTDFRPVWRPGMIFSISLSKLGLPGLRTSVVVADAPVVHALRNMNAIVSLANGNLGQAMLMPFLADDRLIRLGREVIRPFYQKRSEFTRQVLADSLGDSVPWAVHSLEGAFFLWLWLKDSPVPSGELYQRLKARKVLVVPGHYFAFGMDGEWRHPQECLRITCSQPEAVVREGIEILADEVRRMWR
ncbi:MAG TPA: valine--pyruvate transaminase [Verrucomicrobiales bacterium]|nr:valine--pyruvate transaminase [Verrucomicrobiales bacterium]